MSLLKRLLRYCRTKSPWLFHMNSGSCNGCDIELVACLTPRYDVEQIGVHLEGSPRHADILCITGPVTHNTLNAVKTVYGQVPHPKAVVALGSCSASCNAFAGSPSVVGPLHKHIPVDVYVPGCPPRPDAIIEGVVKAAGLLNHPERNHLTDQEMGGSPEPESMGEPQTAEGAPCR
jgi:membrane-bound hydrogenase subunit mbhJ